MSKRVTMGPAMRECLTLLLSNPLPMTVGELAKQGGRGASQRPGTYRAVAHLVAMGMARWIEARPRLVEPTGIGQKWFELTKGR